MVDRRILEGMKVVDFTRVVAGPYATRILADMGADVVKIDSPVGAGGGQSESGTRRSAGSVENNLGKRSIVIDLKSENGIEVARALAVQADVLVENFSPGVMEQVGLGYEVLHALNSRLIYASISGFGHGNSSSHRRAFGATAHAEAGWLWAQQQAAGTAEPFAPGVTVADLITGTLSFSGILAALLDRERTGLGQHVDVSLMDGQLQLISQLASEALNGRTEADWQPFRHPIHRASDGGNLSINIGTPRHFRRIAEGLGHGGAAMPESGPAANAQVKEWVAAITTSAAAAGLEAAGAAYGVVRSMPEAVRDPFFVERGMIIEVDDPIDGRYRGVSSAMFFSDATSAPSGAAPLAGEHSRELLEQLGYDADKVESLLDRAVVQHPAV
jgi:CoA:oxalate CoA-transferase